MKFPKWYRILDAYKYDFDIYVFKRMMEDKDLSDKENNGTCEDYEKICVIVR